jgi:hypothetical protein
VKEQVETALNVTGEKYGNMGLGKPKQALLRDSFVGIVAIVLVNRQAYQHIKGIVVVVK